MSDGDLNPRPESFDEKPGRYEPSEFGHGRKIAAGKWLNRLVLVLVLAAVAYLAYGAATAFFPRWWARQVGDVVGASTPRGLVAGFAVGSVFTLIPVLALAQVRRKFLSWSWRGIVALLAVILALPNWLTIAVAIGTSAAAAEGREIMTAQAPGFRNGSAAGAIAGLVLGLLTVGISMRLARRRRQVASLKSRVAELERKDSGKSESASEPEKTASD